MCFIHVVHMTAIVCLCIVLFSVAGSVVTAGTISTPWTPVTGPPTDSNGAGPDTKNLDVGDVSDVSIFFFVLFFRAPVPVSFYPPERFVTEFATF